MNIRYLLLVFTLLVVEANADSSTLDAAIGGGIGGAAGAAIGNEVDGRDGAIIGGALGGAIGAAVNTKDEPRHTRPGKKGSLLIYNVVIASGI
jgi:outer membrane lipoprotein SlyB